MWCLCQRGSTELCIHACWRCRTWHAMCQWKRNGCTIRNHMVLWHCGELVVVNPVWDWSYRLKCLKWLSAASLVRLEWLTRKRTRRAFSVGTPAACRFMYSCPSGDSFRVVSLFENVHRCGNRGIFPFAKILLQCRAVAWLGHCRF